MHQGISDNRDMINSDRKAASTTRIEISGIRREVTELAECMDSNNTAIDERFVILETDSATKSSTLADFTKKVTEAYKTVYEEQQKQ
jgi:hypothetical protein